MVEKHENGRALREPALVSDQAPSGLDPAGFDPARERCDTCGRFLAFADLCFSRFNYVPLNEFGPEEISWTGPCCRYRDSDQSGAAGQTAEQAGPEGRERGPCEATASPEPNRKTPNV